MISLSARIRRETTISVVINMAIGAGIFLAVFGFADRLAVWGAPGYAIDFVPQGFMVGLMAALVPSLLIRRQVAREAIAPLAGGGPGVRSVFIRSGMLALLSMVVLGAGAAAVLAATGLTTIAFVPALAIKLASSGLVAAVVTPLAMRATVATL